SWPSRCGPCGTWPKPAPASRLRSEVPMLNSEQRQVFATLAETLIPASDTMPSATTAEVSGALLNQALGYRPDLVDALTAALDSSAGKDPEAALDSLSAEQPEQFGALTVL